MSWRGRVGLVVICFALGVGLVAQLRARRGQGPPGGLSTVNQSTLLGSLVVANAELRTEVQKLQSEIQSFERAQERTVPQMMEELNRMRKINGHVGVVGGGVEVRVGGGVTVVDLQDLLNEVRNVGAEAISLNGMRLRVNSSLTTDGRTIAADRAPVEPPYIFQAVGDPATMSTALNRRGGVLNLLRVAYPGIELSVRTVPRLVLPPVQEVREFVLAKPQR